MLAGAEELLSQQRTHPRRAFDRPPARFEIDGPLEEPRTLVAVGVDPELAHHRLVLIDRGGGVGTLVRVDPDGDQGVLQADGADGVCAAGGQT